MKPSRVELKTMGAPAGGTLIEVSRYKTGVGAVHRLIGAPWVSHGAVSGPRPHDIDMMTVCTFDPEGRGGTATLGFSGQMGSGVADAGRTVDVVLGTEVVGAFTLQSGRWPYVIDLDLATYQGGPLDLVFQVRPDQSVMDRDGYDIVQFAFSGMGDPRYGDMELDYTPAEDSVESDPQLTLLLEMIAADPDFLQQLLMYAAATGRL